MSGKKQKAFEVKWRIENIRPWLQTKDDYLYSPSFLAKSLMNTRWKLKLSRKWRQAENCIRLTLQRNLDEYPESITLNYELSFLVYDESPLKSKTCTAKFAPKTVSQELILAGVEILEENKGAYLSEGVLTVCCKLWMPWSTISKGVHCSLRSVIGRKCITLDGTIDYFSGLDYDSNVTLNFISPSDEISFISFDVCRPQNRRMFFERTEVDCKCFSSYSCKLFALKAGGERTECVNSIVLSTLLTSHKSCAFEINFVYGTFNSSAYLKNDTLKLQLEITCYPGVDSAYTEYNDRNYENLADDSVDLGNVNTSKSEKVHSGPTNCVYLSEHEENPNNIEENISSNEDEYFCTVIKKNLPSTSLLKDMISMYKDKLFCDTKLRTDTETFQAHRNVLSARSPVFKKMFTTDMKEKAGECINIPDISSDTVRRMLQFLYSDCTGELEMQSAKDLYIASDKYDIGSLKEQCSAFMKENLCLANVCEVLVLADMHQDKDLESAAQEYVLVNDEEVFYSDEWKLFMKNYGCLAAQVMYLKLTKR